MTEPIDQKLRNRLTRFLHTGLEVPKYYPGCWSAHKYYEVDKLAVLNEIFAKDPENIEVVNIILKAYEDGWYTRFETLAFALIKCLLCGDKNVKKATYRAVLIICNKPEDFLLFQKFTRVFRTGNGQGWCKNVRTWYGNKEALELARDVSRIRSCHGRSHKTLIRKSHYKVPADDQAREVIIKYTLYGLKQAKTLVGDGPDTKAVFDFIKQVEDLRHCEDPVAAACLVAKNNFTMEYVPGHFLAAQDVWDAALPQFTMSEILYNIQRIHNMGFLTDDSTTTAILLSLLNNKELVSKSKITPIEVYITLCNYRKKSKPMKYQKAKITLEKESRRRLRQVFDPKTNQWKWSATRRHPKEIKHWGIDNPPNLSVLIALEKLINETWLLSSSTGAHYMITLDMRHHMFLGRHFCKSYAVPKKIKKVSTTKSCPVTPGAGGDTNTEKPSNKRPYAECFYNENVTPGEAAIILMMQILKREKNVKVAVFTEDGIDIVKLDRNISCIKQVESVLRACRLGRVQLDAPIEWAIKNDHHVDVFINMVDRTTRYMELDKLCRGGRGSGGYFGPPPSSPDVPDHCPVRALVRYRSARSLPDSKLIVLSLASHRVATTDGSHEGVLDIVGIDEHVPKVMDAFVTGQFK